MFNILLNIKNIIILNIFTKYTSKSVYWIINYINTWIQEFMYIFFVQKSHGFGNWFQFYIIFINSPKIHIIFAYKMGKILYKLNISSKYVNFHWF